MHDPRVGRFFAVDPLTGKYPWYTPYSFSGNKPIQFVELEGLEEGIPRIQGDTDVMEDLLLPVKDGVRNTIWLPILRISQSDEEEGKHIREALSKMNFDKELYSSISNEDLANSFDIRSHSGGNLGVFPEEGAGDRLLTFVGDALDVASVIPTKSGVFLAIKTGIGANGVSSILRGLRINSRTREILMDFTNWKDAKTGALIRDFEAEGVAIFEETFNVTTRALKKTDFFKEGDFIITSGKLNGKSVDLVTANPKQKFDQFFDSVKSHYNKQGVDFVNVDIRKLSGTEKKVIKDYLNSLPKNHFNRTIITE